MIDFAAVQMHIDLNEVVFLQDDDGTIYKCTNTDTFRAYGLLKYTLRLLEDQGAAQALWELAYD